MNLREIDVNALGLFEFSSSLSRMGIMESLSYLIVTPLPHRNTIKFMGIEDKDDYLCYTTIEDKFVALTPAGVLQSWSLVTGKALKTTKLEQNFEGFDV